MLSSRCAGGRGWRGQGDARITASRSAAAGLSDRPEPHEGGRLTQAIDTEAPRATLPEDAHCATWGDDETRDGQVAHSGAGGIGEPSCRGSARSGSSGGAACNDRSPTVRLPASADHDAAACG